MSIEKITVADGSIMFGAEKVARIGERFSKSGYRWVWEETSANEVSLFRIGGADGKRAVTSLLKNNAYARDERGGFMRVRKTAPRKG